MRDSDDLYRDRSLDRARQFEALCDEFEALCKKGARPSIENFLLRVDEQDKQSMLIELIAIEMFYRHRQGESIAVSEYQTRVSWTVGIQAGGKRFSSVHTTVPGSKSIYTTLTCLQLIRAAGKHRRTKAELLSISATTNF